MKKSAPQEDRDGDRRARELFHYFQPDNPALLPTGHNATVSTQSTPLTKASPNLVLTALAQLAAVKLDVQRAVIRYGFPVALPFQGIIVNAELFCAMTLPTKVVLDNPSSRNFSILFRAQEVLIGLLRQFLTFRLA